MVNDPLLDPVAIVEWAIDTGIFDLMYSAWGWPLAEIVHFTGLCLLAGSVGLFDLRVLGGLRTLPLAGLHRLVPLGVAGFALCAITGLMFVTSSPDQYLYNPAWQVKMGLIGLAGANMVLFYATTARALRDGDQAAPPPLAAKAFALVSLISWTGVIAAGRVITAFRPPAWEWCAWCG